MWIQIRSRSLLVTDTDRIWGEYGSVTVNIISDVVSKMVLTYSTYYEPA